MSLRSSRSPLRSLSDDERDDQREKIKEGLNKIWRLLTEALSKLNELVSNSASQSVVVESNPGFRNSEAVAYVATEDHVPIIGPPLPGIPGISGNLVSMVLRWSYEAEPTSGG